MTAGYRGVVRLRLAPAQWIEVAGEMSTTTEIADEMVRKSWSGTLTGEPEPLWRAFSGQRALIEIEDRRAWITCVKLERPVREMEFGGAVVYEVTSIEKDWVTARLRSVALTPCSPSSRGEVAESRCAVWSPYKAWTRALRVRARLFLADERTQVNRS